jgi:hypothetical protein
MTPELKKIGNKLFLGTQKVELALTDDVKTLYENANKVYAQNGDLLDKYAQALEKAFQSAADEYKKALDKFSQLEKSSKDLGIDLPQDIAKLKSLIEYGLKDSLNSKQNAVKILSI